MTSAATIEIREADGALERIEAYLVAAGFFALPSDEAPTEPAGECADVYLAFGLSEPLRRSGRAGRPEPADLPLAAVRLRRGGETETAAAFEVGAWESSWTDRQYAEAVGKAREAIAAGEVYQVNLVQHLSAPFAGDPRGLAEALGHFAPLHPRVMSGEGWAIVSASPELFLARRGDRVWTMPIKGSRPRGDGAGLSRSTKDAAEHVMIVDLERNDLGRICEPGSVGWPELMQVRSMAGVEHLVSRVEGTLRAGVGWAEAVGAMFPGGSVTGAPKVAALDHINALEPVGRGASMGALGTVWPNGDFQLALTIRTFAVSAGRLHLWVGGGVVWDSDAAAEVEESWVKARPLLAALERASRGRAAA